MLEILATLAIFRFAHMLQVETGPLDIFVRLRNIFFEEGDIQARPRMGFWPDLIKCYLCLSIWLAAPCAVYFARTDWWSFPIYWLGLSGAAMIIKVIYERLEV